MDSVLVSNEDTKEYFYTFRVDTQTGAMGFFKVEEPTLQPAGEAWLRVKGTATNPPLPQYYWTKNGLPTAVQSLPAARAGKVDEIYDLTGRRIDAAAMRPGHLYIVNGEKRIK